MFFAFLWVTSVVLLLVSATSENVKSLPTIGQQTQTSGSSVGVSTRLHNLPAVSATHGAAIALCRSQLPKKTHGEGSKKMFPEMQETNVHLLGKFKTVVYRSSAMDMQFQGSQNAQRTHSAFARKRMPNLFPVESRIPSDWTHRMPGESDRNPNTYKPKSVRPKTSVWRRSQRQTSQPSARGWQGHAHRSVPWQDATHKATVANTVERLCEDSTRDIEKMSILKSSSTSTRTAVVEEGVKQEEDIYVVLERKPRRNVTWTGDTVDNEFMCKKKSKKCCIFHKPRRWDESSSDESESAFEDESSSSSSGPLRPLAAAIPSIPAPEKGDETDECKDKSTTKRSAEIRSKSDTSGRHGRCHHHCHGHTHPHSHVPIDSELSTMSEAVTAKTESVIEDASATAPLCSASDQRDFEAETTVLSKSKGAVVESSDCSHQTDCGHSSHQMDDSSLVV